MARRVNSPRCLRRCPVSQGRAQGLLVIAASIGVFLLVLALSQSVSLTEFDQHHPDPSDPPSTIINAQSSIGQSLTIGHDHFDTFSFRATQPQIAYSNKVRVSLLQGGPHGAALKIAFAP